MLDFIPSEFHLGLLLFVYLYYDVIGEWMLDNFFSKNEDEMMVPMPVSVSTPKVEFEDLYKKELADMETVKLTDEQLTEKTNSFVMENTPMGFVIMSWCQEHHRFNYLETAIFKLV